MASAPAYDLDGLVNAPQQRRSLEKSLRILTAAEKILRDGGGDALTIDAVAKRAKVSVGGIYGRFSNRDELLSAVYLHVMQNLVSEVQSEFERPISSLEDFVRRFVQVMVKFFQKNGQIMPLLGKDRINQKAANDTEGKVCEILDDALTVFRDEISGQDPSRSIRFIVHLVAASVTRESGTQPTNSKRLVGWELLEQELALAAYSYLTARPSIQV